MKYYDFTAKQLEDKALELLIEFDEERIHKTKPIDVYAVIEKCLNVPYDWKYLTPDQSVLGVTVFSGGTLWVWPESKYYDGLIPYQIDVEPGTILIDSTLTEQKYRGRENFTVMHEVFHQVLHKKCFRTMPKNYVHLTESKTIEGNIRYASYALAVIERQANACAAAFLMPRNLVIKNYKGWYEYMGDKTSKQAEDGIIEAMAGEFSVSKQAMFIRLKQLGLMGENKENLLK